MRAPAEIHDFARRIRATSREWAKAAVALEQELHHAFRIACLDAMFAEVREHTFVVDAEGRIPLVGPEVWVVIGPGGFPTDIRVVPEWLHGWPTDPKKLAEEGFVMRGRDLLDREPEIRSAVASGALLVPAMEDGRAVLREPPRSVSLKMVRRGSLPSRERSGPRPPSD